MKNEENTSDPESLPETESANEETDNSTTSKLIEDETYYFDDAMFTINGIQLTVNSITLHREYKPEGYSLEVAYSKPRLEFQSASASYSIFTRCSAVAARSGR